MTSRSTEIEILILGAGWTSTFLIPLLKAENISYEATTTTGRDDTTKWRFDPDSDDSESYRRLPRAKTILVTFPVKGKGQYEKLLSTYSTTHAHMLSNWIQLGSTGIFTGEGWNDRHSPYDTSNLRAMAEDELLEQGGCVLNLAGLYGGTREPRNWVSRVAKDKEQLKNKKALHLIHGDDVARAIVAMHKRFYAGERWLLTDLIVHDWWKLVWDWADSLEAEWKGAEEDKPQYKKWVQECMNEEDVRALPRSIELLGRVLDSRDFWNAMKMRPSRSIVTRSSL